MGNLLKARSVQMSVMLHVLTAKQSGWKHFGKRGMGLRAAVPAGISGSPRDSLKRELACALGRRLECICVGPYGVATRVCWERLVSLARSCGPQEGGDGLAGSRAPMTSGAARAGAYAKLARDLQSIIQ